MKKISILAILLLSSCKDSVSIESSNETDGRKIIKYVDSKNQNASFERFEHKTYKIRHIVYKNHDYIEIEPIGTYSHCHSWVHDPDCKKCLNLFD